MATKITAEGGIHTVKVASLQDLQREVGGLIQDAGRVYYEDELVTILCDEEGLLKQLPINEWVLEYYGRPIVGTVLLVNHEEFN